MESDSNPADDACSGLDSKIKHQIKIWLMIYHSCGMRNSVGCKNVKSKKYLKKNQN